MELPRMKLLAHKLGTLFGHLPHAASTLQAPLAAAGGKLSGMVRPLLLGAVVVGGGYLLVKHSPLENVERGEVGLRVNQLTGGVTEVREGPIVVIPGLYRLQRYSLRDQLYRNSESAQADGKAPFQSVEGLSLGVDITVRYALDPARVATIARSLPADLGGCSVTIKPETSLSISAGESKPIGSPKVRDKMTISPANDAERARLSETPHARYAYELSPIAACRPERSFDGHELSVAYPSFN